MGPASESVVASKAHEQGKKMERVAVWVKSSLASAFFGSLEKCSCINIATTDEEHEDQRMSMEEQPRAALMREEPSCPQAAISMGKWSQEEAPLQSWANQTVPFMGSPHGMARFT